MDTFSGFLTINEVYERLGIPNPYERLLEAIEKGEEYHGWSQVKDGKPLDLDLLCSRSEVRKREDGSSEIVIYLPFEWKG